MWIARGASKGANRHELARLSVRSTTRGTTTHPTASAMPIPVRR